MDCTLQLPSLDHLISAIQIHRKTKSLDEATRLHTQACSFGLETHRDIGNHVVPMFVQCGSLYESYRAFHRLYHTKEYSWTSLIQGHVSDGQCELAFKLYQEMLENRIQATSHTYVALLRAAASMKSVVNGHRIHSDICTNVSQLDIFLGNTLVDMYAKCGLISDAHDVFDELVLRDVVSWNVLLAGYVDNGLGEEALMCHDQMQAEGLRSDEVTFLSSLKACSSIRCIHTGLELHADVVMEGFDSDLSISNILVNMYSKCCFFEEAEDVFNEIPDPDIISYTSIIAGYAEQGLGEEALKYFDEMLLRNIPPNDITFIYSLRACSSIRNVARGQEVHNEIYIRGKDKDSFLCSNLVDMYAKCGYLPEAQMVFDYLPNRDVVSWNALIFGYADQGLGEEALSYFEEMQLGGMSPNATTFVSVLKACSSIGDLHSGRQLHLCILKEVFDSLPMMNACLVDMYAKCGSLSEAVEIFQDLMPVQDVQLWGSLIRGCVEHGENEKAFFLTARMQEEGLLPTNIIFSIVLKACGNIAALEPGRRIHSQLCRSDILDNVIFIALIDMYGKCGGVIDGSVFDTIPTMDSVQWSALITGFARQGCTGSVLELFERMKDSGVSPNEVTFLSVLSSCNHAGLVDKGKEYYESMKSDYGIAPTIKHYNCMIDLFIRAGQLNDAISILEAMPMQPDHVTWASLLSACRVTGNGKLISKVFRYARKMYDKHPSLFVQMSNLIIDS